MTSFFLKKGEIDLLIYDSRFKVLPVMLGTHTFSRWISRSSKMWKREISKRYHLVVRHGSPSGQKW